MEVVERWQFSYRSRESIEEFKSQLCEFISKQH
ncbi:hypothetical protein USA300HOU_0101 [Staphylococcus aureus subsp. aureus USA300_TCH1516]|nr:hypothetical protein USA300HOU_0101 [Staphylococcus aureus subsp. aureus USA300_TCH1516]